MSFWIVFAVFVCIVVSLAVVFYLAVTSTNVYAEIEAMKKYIELRIEQLKGNK